MAIVLHDTWLVTSALHCFEILSMLGDLATSSALTRVVWQGSRVSLHMPQLVTYVGYLPFLGPVKHFVVALQENMEFRSLLQRRIFASLIWNARPAALFPCFSAYTMTFRFKAES